MNAIKATEFSWTESISVGNETLDEQHRGIFAATNRLLDIVMGNRRLEETYGALVEIERYVRDHFSSEEAYMKDHGYPDLDRHQKIHAAFAENFLERKEEVKTKGVSETIVLQLENYLGTWLLHHIGEEDQKYARFIREKSAT